MESLALVPDTLLCSSDGNATPPSLDLWFESAMDASLDSENKLIRPTSPTTGNFSAPLVSCDSVFTEEKQWPLTTLLVLNEEEPPAPAPQKRTRPVRTTAMRRAKAQRRHRVTKREKPSPEQVELARRARLERNRQTARDCRRRKKLYVQKLEQKVKLYESEDKNKSTLIARLQSENANLRAQLDELKQRFS